MAKANVGPINFQLYYRAVPGETYRESDSMKPGVGALQYPGVCLNLDTEPALRETLDMIFEFGNGSGIELLPRSLSVGDVICVWLNPLWRAQILRRGRSQLPPGIRKALRGSAPGGDSACQQGLIRQRCRAGLVLPSLRLRCAPGRRADIGPAAKVVVEA